jgi:Amt family ammonium transporter
MFKQLKTRVIALMALVSLVCMPTFAHAATTTIDSGDTAWLLISAALVMLMTPGLAFFYAGMVRNKNVVSTLLQNYVALALVGILWACVGYSLVFTEGNAFIGGLKYKFLEGVDQGPAPIAASVPHLAFMAFQMMFAIITPALITGSIAERINFKGWLVFCAAWSLAVYVPVAHWVWGPGGWLVGKGALDFAGGIVVHLTSGCSALVAAFALGQRHDAKGTMKPTDVGMVMLGAALLWFGWFGFNAGSAITSGGLAAHAFVTTFLAAAAAFLGWLLVDWIRLGKPSAVGASIGLVVGLVVITPAAGFVSTSHAMIMGGAGAILSNIIAVYVKKISHYFDDTLDVFACHGVGGIFGSIFTGLFASSVVNPAVTNEGYFVSGKTELFMANLEGTVIAAVYSMIVTFILIKLINVVIPLRVGAGDEASGLDPSSHGETFRS